MDDTKNEALLLVMDTLVGLLEHLNELELLAVGTRSNELDLETRMATNTIIVELRKLHRKLRQEG